jgi:hypothetical protein
VANLVAVQVKIRGSLINCFFHHSVYAFFLTESMHIHAVHPLCTPFGTVA